MRDALVAAAQEIHAERYAGAEVVFLAGSLMRGEGTATSDLDLVVVFPQLPAAWRDTFRHGRWPVEAFVHDPQTLAWFFEHSDGPSGIPSLATMISEGVEIPGSTDFSKSIRDFANQTLSKGPPAWSSADLDKSRYAITNYLDDLVDPRSRAEQMATAMALHGALSNHYFRARGLWSAKDKSIPRRLHKVDPDLSIRFEAAFASLFQQGQAEPVVVLAEEIIAADGGRLLDGYTLPAPADWRLPDWKKG